MWLELSGKSSMGKLMQRLTKAAKPPFEEHCGDELAQQPESGVAMQATGWRSMSLEDSAGALNAGKVSADR